MMIFGTYERLQVGTTLTSEYITNDINEVHSPQPFYIVREVTRQEWIDYIESQGGLLKITQNYPKYFYEVSTD